MSYLQGKKKSANFSKEEMKLIHTLYKENYDVYHEKVKASKTGEPSRRDKLLKEWSKKVTAIGVQLREPANIKQKIKKDMYNAQSIYMEYEEKLRSCAVPAPPNPHLSHPHYSILFDILENNRNRKDKGIERKENTMQEKCAASPSPSNSDIIHSCDDEDEINIKYDKIAEEMSENFFSSLASNIDWLNNTEERSEGVLWTNPDRTNHEDREDLMSSRLKLVKMQREATAAKRRKLDLECTLLESKIKLVNEVSKLL